MSTTHFYSHYPTIEYKTCALYVRCSKEEQAKFGDTIEAQIEDLKAFAKLHHLKIYAIYVDEGHTARKKYNKRKEFMRMLQDVELHKFEYIIFTKLDRWFRNIADFYKIQEILDNNGVTWLTALERYEMETTNGKLNVNIRLSVAQDEADRDSDRIKDVFRLKVKKGEAITGSLPIGLMVGEMVRLILTRILCKLLMICLIILRPIIVSVVLSCTSLINTTAIFVMKLSPVLCGILFTRGNTGATRITVLRLSTLPDSTVYRCLASVMLRFARITVTMSFPAWLNAKSAVMPL